MEVKRVAPTEAEVDRANLFCNSFIRFIISEGIDPGNALMYVAAAASQIARNVSMGSGIAEEEVVLMFAENMIFFLEVMSVDRKTAYPMPHVRKL